MSTTSFNAETISLIIILLTVSTLTGSIGALALKKAMNDIHTLTVKSALTNIWVYIGVLLYIVSVIANIFLYRYLDYSIAFPMTALSYVWTIIISYFTFKEPITLKKIIAIVLIIGGISLLNL